MQPDVSYEDFLATARRAFESGQPVDAITLQRLMQANAACLAGLGRVPPRRGRGVPTPRALPGLRRCPT